MADFCDHRLADRIRREMNDAENDIGSRTVDSLLNFETVRYFNNESHEVARLDETLADYEKAAVRTRESLSLLNVAQAGVVTLGVTLMWCWPPLISVTEI